MTQRQQRRDPHRRVKERQSQIEVRHHHAEDVEGEEASTKSQWNAEQRPSAGKAEGDEADDIGDEEPSGRSIRWHKHRQAFEPRPLRCEVRFRRGQDEDQLSGAHRPTIEKRC